MTRKQSWLVAGVMLAVSLLTVLLFSLPVQAAPVSSQVYRIGQQEYDSVLYPQVLDTAASTYDETLTRFTFSHVPSGNPADYREVRVVFSCRKFTPVPFRTLSLSLPRVPAQYADNVLACLHTSLYGEPAAPGQFSLSLLLYVPGMDDAQIASLVETLTFDLAWGFAQGIDGHVFSSVAADSLEFV